MIENEPFWKTLVIGFLANELTADDERKLMDWLEASADHRQYFQEVEKIWFVGDLHASQHRYNANVAWNQFSDRIGREAATADDRPPKRMFFKRLLPYAAVLALGFLMGFLVLEWIEADTGRNEVLVMSTPRGSMSKAILADGTTVFLNADSRMTVSPGFGRSERRVQLSGEAYFEVAKDEKRRFVIEADGVEVAVLGTKFNLRNYGGDDKLTLHLLEGAVQMGGEGLDGVVLKPNDEAVLLKATSEISIAHRNAAQAIRWTEGKLIFDSLPFHEIKIALERHYDVEIQVHDDKLNNRIFFGEFENGETIEQVLNVITADGSYRYTIKKNKIDIYKL
ncbi:FecR family protein [Parapedobacter deserti]|uniref:FecR family protein n=1 Tax=Parapedobacter deserti TaxID=1912957 RepID=A0ABV7JSB9_9SPHI